ncbi:hypothetical protein NARC_10207 [Candidatus Nitrosocosmicus arcticus]|uniref:Uncharacterized protein n=1 Tax=Candidatus Nitrosocosmicus arcticus TaxID=2035267 RepID=A0A557SYX0_9ARCH|nr:hypothetical protein NARC_10207 [Candidatus Nitrosocosmicus arcticus]
MPQHMLNDSLDYIEIRKNQQIGNYAIVIKILCHLMWNL